MQTSDDGRPLSCRSRPCRALPLSPVPGFTKAALEVWAASSLMPTACVVSNGLWCFDGVTQKAASHERHVTGGGRQAAQRPEFRWVNTMCARQPENGPQGHVPGYRSRPICPSLSR
ncbi:MAG: transposase [Burkholderia sp.]